MDLRVEEGIQTLIVPWRMEIGRFVADVVKSWHTRTIVDRVELGGRQGSAIHPPQRDPGRCGGRLRDLRPDASAALKTKRSAPLLLGFRGFGCSLRSSTARVA